MKGDFQMKITRKIGITVFFGLTQLTFMPAANWAKQATTSPLTEPVLYYSEHTFATGGMKIGNVSAISRLSSLDSERRNHSVLVRERGMSFTYGLGPSLQADKGVMAVARWQEGGQLCIGTCDLQGKNWTSITHPPDNFLDHSPLFSPNGEYIAFLRSARDTLPGTLCVYKLSDSTLKQYCEVHLLSQQAWLHDSSCLVFTKCDSPGIWMLKVSNGELKQIAQTERCREPAFDPTGTKVAFVSEGTPVPLSGLRNVLLGGDICTKEITSSKISFLAKGWLHMPLWSPDGAKISCLRAYITKKPISKPETNQDSDSKAKDVEIMDDCEIMTVIDSQILTCVPIGYCMYRRPVAWLPTGNGLIVIGKMMEQKPNPLDIKFGEEIKVDNPMGFSGDVMHINPEKEPMYRSLYGTQTFDGASLDCCINRSGSILSDHKERVIQSKVDTLASGKTQKIRELPTGSQLLPPFESKLKGTNEVRIRNPNQFSVAAGLRMSNKGIDFEVPAKGKASVFVPNGNYDIYFVYSTKPDALFQGDSFTLNSNGVEIQIVEVVGGNYGIRRVK